MKYNCIYCNDNIDLKSICECYLTCNASYQEALYFKNKYVIRINVNEFFPNSHHQYYILFNKTEIKLYKQYSLNDNGYIEIIHQVLFELQHDITTFNKEQLKKFIKVNITL